LSTILLTCGETSGEHHASLVVSKMRAMDPSCRVVALGGSELEKAGAEIAFPMEQFAFMGFAEVLSGLPRVLSLERKLKSLLKEGGVDLFLPVDYPGLNLRMARYARRVGVPVLYFISPQVWAWGGWRIKKMKKAIDLMALILPFEWEIYRSAGIPAVFVGYMMLEQVEAPPSPKEAPSTNDRFKVLLFPGIRTQEVERILPLILAAAKILKESFPEVVFNLGLAPLIDERSLRIPEDMEPFIEITRDGIGQLGDASLALAASGTVTLQCAISGTPTIVFYKTSPVTYCIGKLLVRIPWIAMPNVLAGKHLVPELIQGGATPERIATVASALLLDRERYRRLSAELLELRTRLEGPGGASRVAEIALRMSKGEGVGEILTSLDLEWERGKERVER
jgi:lipid-A-disaccharide synthase